VFLFFLGTKLPVFVEAIRSTDFLRSMVPVFGLFEDKTFVGFFNREV